MNVPIMQFDGEKLVTPLGPLFIQGRASKTKPLKAKPINTIMTDMSIASKFLLATLEGQQSLRHDSFVCIGDDDDAWQQPREKLLAKYNIVDVDVDGWMTCVPKEGNEVNVIKVTEHFGCADGFKLVAQWGEEQDDGTFLQSGEQGDYILQNPEDLMDLWIVAKKVFETTYEITPS